MSTAAAAPPSHARAVLEGVLPQAACQELLLLARSLAVLGYREGVCSATIFDVAAALPAALVPLVAVREAVRAAVEDAWGLPLLIEFTGLICWRPGSSIGWHHDANRPYLRQRTHSAVCYLQAAGRDFAGGTFQFREADGRVADVLAAPGRVVAYNAQQVHGVTRVQAGERCALTLWFTETPEHSEDARLLAVLPGPAQPPPLGLPASMWRLPDGADLRLCRLAMVGFALVHRGRLLCSTDGLPEGPAVAGEGEADGRQLQLAVQPGVLRAWLAWHEDQAALVEGAAVAHDAAVGADDDPVPAAAELVAGVEFGNVQEAVLAVQRWAWRRCPPGCWGRERVCCTHLCEASPAHPSACASCSWLRSARLEGSSQDGTELGAQLRNATLESGEWLAGHAAALKALRPRWQQLGALFVD